METMQKAFCVGTRVIHSRRGMGVITETCAKLQETNPDRHSMFVDFGDGAEEVSKHLIEVDTMEQETEPK